MFAHYNTLREATLVFSGSVLILLMLCFEAIVFSTKEYIILLPFTQIVVYRVNRLVSSKTTGVSIEYC